MMTTARAKSWIIMGLAALFVAEPAMAKFVVEGSREDRRTWNQMLRSCKRKSRSLRTLINKIKRHETKQVTIKLVRNKASVKIDAFNTREVDLTDLEDLAACSAAGVVDRCQMIAHFLAERWDIAEHPLHVFKQAHSVGIAAENAYRADRGHTDMIQDEPNKRGHHNSDNGKAICHLFKSGDSKFKRYDAIPGNRTEVAFIPPDEFDAPGVYVMNIDPGFPNQTIVQVPQGLGGGVLVAPIATASCTIELSEPFMEGESEFAFISILSLQGTAPSISLPFIPEETGPNQFQFQQTQDHYGIADLSSGQIWVSFNGIVTNNLFPPEAPLQTYSTLAMVIEPGAPLAGPPFGLFSNSIFLDGEGDPTWSHYPVVDCDEDGVQDYLDIVIDLGQDDGTLCGFGAENGVHDDCDCDDCNDNGSPDVLDILDGTSEDCFKNGIPDECDIAEGRAADDNGNGVVDICEGACCFDDGTCEDRFFEECTQAVGNYRGDGRLCADVHCRPPGVE